MEKEYSIEYPFSFCATAGHLSPQRLETTQIASEYSLKKHDRPTGKIIKQKFYF